MPEQEVIHNALYSDTLGVNQVVGSLLTEDGFYIVMKVKGWTDRVVITVKDIKLTRNPERGLVDLTFKVFNQNSEMVLSAEGKYLIQTRHQG